MAGSTFGTLFSITTWGESHGKAIGVVVDGCPAGLSLCEEDIQYYLNLRRPGQNAFTTPRNEKDQVSILSGVFEGRTTGTPISLIVYNEDHHSADYSQIQDVYRPGHADYTFDEKFGFRDYRGGGRSSGRETLGRVAAGAIAIEFLKTLGIEICAYTKSIGTIICGKNDYISNLSEDNRETDTVLFDRISKEGLKKLRADKFISPLYMPDADASRQAEDALTAAMEAKDSMGGIIECVVSGMPAGIGEPVFDKLDAGLAKAMLSIGAVKGFELGAGFAVSESKGSENNDAFVPVNDTIRKATNHAGGILGGISDGSDIVFRTAIKPTPSIFTEQTTVNKDGEAISVEIKGRHDPIIVPRAVVVVEAMTALTIADALLVNMHSKLDDITKFYS